MSTAEVVPSLNSFLARMLRNRRTRPATSICVSATLDDLRQSGLEPIDPPSVGKDGNTQAWVRDPDGNLIELMQIARDSDQGRVVAAEQGR